VAVIEANKHVNHLPHFHSAHAYLGVITFGLLVVQYLFGFTILLVPRVWGGVDKAKAKWKYRMSCPVPSITRPSKPHDENIGENEKERR
jgi:hypothetical protein